jgi:competence protein ComEA
MLAKLYPQTPPTLFVLAVSFFFLFLLSRNSSSVDNIPAFLPLTDNYIYVELSGETEFPGVYQINDGLLPIGVISLTGEDASLIPLARELVLQNGENIKVVKKEQKIGSFNREWMSASHRVSMGIPLHPDRMTFEDWQFLPGIGEALARRLELDRQENGEFVSLKALLRVKGIGLKRIERWRIFFNGM